MNATAKHTPGPWTTVGSNDGTCDIGIRAPNVVNVVAECFADMRHAGEFNLAEVAANARLIAAAPDMLAALIDLDARLRECGALHTAEDAYDSFYRGIVEEAIRRATGEGK
jgi:hypothetical protein